MSYQDQQAAKIAELKILAQAYNLSEKLTIEEWENYLSELYASGVDIDETRKIALRVLHDQALKIDFSRAVDINAMRNPPEPPKKKRYKTPFGEKLGACKTLDDYINLASSNG